MCEVFGGIKAGDAPAALPESYFIASIKPTAYHFRMNASSSSMVYAAWTTAAGPMGAVKNAARPSSPPLDRIGAALSDVEEPKSCGLVRIILPHYSLADLADLLVFEYPGSVEAPEEFADLVELSKAYFNGQVVGFNDVICDLPSEKTFTGRVLRACRTIPYGQTRSYSWLADAADRMNSPPLDRLGAALNNVEGPKSGKPGGARPHGRPSGRAAAVALGRNPLPLVVPCHRVIYADGKLGGFSAAGGTELKQRMLTIEGAL